ncbi:uncharacterized protein EI90DRAFT_3035048 [Cantharellus anzutake]|uniref:uncharacterized protein n=1 Tax=Cantharellus anzutake TaxID=1750568 RepID=UPI00190496B5|nr:uncharacterized protein EI90DRAFT_3035048 [Cantharellus anzutake]KAF8340276.1 hypothetical protein EI90DRAFT_3035048 [Cantharellus anzutake]
MAPHILKQLRYIAFGAATTWYFNVPKHISEVLDRGVTTLPGALTVTSIALQILAVGVFLYILVYLPRIKGIHPDYSHWPQNELSTAVPWLTFGIIGGWSSLFYALWSYTELVLWKSIVASLGFYALTVGIIGLIPTPTPPPRPEGAGEDDLTPDGNHPHHD